jgi:hypothetical protein
MVSTSGFLEKSLSISGSYRVRRSFETAKDSLAVSALPLTVFTRLHESPARTDERQVERFAATI